jgi:hypothetical protein
MGLIGAQWAAVGASWSRSKLDLEAGGAGDRVHIGAVGRVALLEATVAGRRDETLASWRRRPVESRRGSRRRGTARSQPSGVGRGPSGSVAQCRRLTALVTRRRTARGWLHREATAEEGVTGTLWVPFPLRVPRPPDHLWNDASPFTLGDFDPFPHAKRPQKIFAIFFCEAAR